MLVGVKTQEDLWGKEGIITQLNKALLERILTMLRWISTSITPTKDAPLATLGMTTVRKLSKATLDTWNCQLLETGTAFKPQIIPKRSTKSAMA